jgi:ankyrin repeat protein
MKYYFKLVAYLIVFIGFSHSVAGSYDDFFVAVARNNPEAVQSLLNRGFDPNTLSPKGEYGLILALREGSLKVVDVLLDQPGTTVEVRTAQDESPLMLAALKGHMAISQKLIARDADVNKPGWTPLHYAATGGHTPVMRLLLENHAYIDAASPNGSTPLMMAAKYGSAPAVQLLLEAGADPSLKNGLGLSAIDFARTAQRTDSVEIIASFIRAQKPKGSW